MDVPGSFDSSMELSTPIKNLRLGSPSRLSPIYPNLDDILPSSSPPLNSYMQSLGYSRKLSSNVLKELNQRASQISEKMKSPPSSHAQARRRSKLESISSHYSVLARKKLHNKESPQSASQSNTNSISNSNSNSTSTSQSAEYKEHSNKRESLVGSAYSKRRRTSNLAGEPNMIHLPRSSPLKQFSSPLKRISPSKKYNDLHSILTSEPEEKTSPVKFAVPKPPTRTLTSRPSVLQLAGVKPLPANHNSTHTTLSGSPSSKSLTSTKKPPAPVLSKTQALKPKTSASSLKAQPNQLHSKQPPNQPNHPHSLSSSHSLSRSVPNLAANSSIPSLKPAPKVKLTRSPTSRSLKAPTVPQPFSLYDKPTVSSSQKSLDRFQKFKSKFK
ncbi:hypothetical protein JA9_003191 [Meyerozyma sp. JA9]|nr:hypothetical protein JA9_003191 [Meyerozyma sp. JA9]